MISDLTPTIRYLQQFESKTAGEAIESPEKIKIIQALKQIQQQSDYQIFGVLAETYDQAIAAVHDYAKAFNYPMPKTPEALEGPVYLKYNPSTQLCYCNPYTGDHRGVLISFQSDFEDGTNEMFGHFPIDLYR